LGKLTEKHGYKMIPTAEAFGVALGLMPKNQIKKVTSMKQSYQLTEQACMSYHRFTSLLLANGFLSLLNQHASQGGFFSRSHLITSD
jgi:hypothetical protein